MIKILFLDTTALSSYFIQDNGTATMRWLISDQNQAHKKTRYLTNKQATDAFHSHLNTLINRKAMPPSAGRSIDALFKGHIKRKQFQLVGNDASIRTTLAGIHNFMGKITAPILVTCNEQQAQLTREQGYQTINPAAQTPAEIESMLSVGNLQIGDNLPASNESPYQKPGRRLFNLLKTLGTGKADISTAISK